MQYSYRVQTDEHSAAGRQTEEYKVRDYQDNGRDLTNCGEQSMPLQYTMLFMFINISNFSCTYNVYNNLLNYIIASKKNVYF